MPTILVVDDRALNRELIVSLLGYENHRVIEAADGAEGLQKTRVERPDLIITDIVMPTMDGFEFVQKLRADPSLTHIPVIFYTATYIEREARSLARACNVHYVITKPSDPQKILDAVAMALGSKPPLAPPPLPVEGIPSPSDVLADKLLERSRELECMSQRLTALIEVGLEFTSQREPELLLQNCCHSSRKIIGAKYSAVAILDGNGDRLSYLLGSGMDPAIAAAAGTPDWTRGVIAEILRTKRPCRVRDISAEPSTLGLAPGHPQIKNFIGVPIQSVDDVYGWLSLADKLGAEEFSEQDERVAATLAAQVAACYKKAQLYDELQSHSSRLMREMEERKKLEQQLLQSQKMEAVGQLAGGIAHDFNNLLTIITGYSELILNRLPSGDGVREKMEEIKTAADRAASLTRQLLAFSRRQVLQPRVVDLNQIVANTDRMLRRLIGEDIDLVALCPPGVGRVKVDPGQIEQVIMNLAVNARDAMPQGGKLTIETANVELDGAYASNHVAVKSGPYVMLAVSDTGHGISPETQARIFEPFFTTKEQNKGTGLGLSTVYGIVKQSGGNIWVYSEPGKGATFKIYLPRVEEAPQPKTEVETAPATLRGTETVLLVEDEAAVRLLVRGVLEENGYHVLDAGSGAEALVMANNSKQPIHLLVTDVVMPGMSGREVAQQVTLAHPETKVLFMSGYTDDAIVRHGVLESSAAFVQKPFTPDNLLRKIREALDLKPHSS